MRRVRLRRALFVGALGAVAASLPLFSCADPYAETQNAGPEGSTPDSAIDGNADVYVPVVDSGDPDAVVGKDAGNQIDAANCTVCDCDGDGFNDLGKAGCADAGGTTDCDDTMSGVRPNQGFLDTPNPPRNGDWNCSNVVEKLYATNVSCTGNAGAACSAKQGFSGDPACGASGPYVQCGTVSLTSCGISSTIIRIQPCK